MEVPSRVPNLQPPRPVVVEVEPEPEPVVSPPPEEAPSSESSQVPASPRLAKKRRRRCRRQPPRIQPINPAATLGANRPTDLGSPRPATASPSPRPVVPPLDLRYPGPAAHRRARTGPIGPAAHRPGVPPRPGASPGMSSPRTGPGAPPRTGGPAAPAGGGAAGDARHRRSASQRAPGTLSRPGQPGAPAARAGGPAARGAQEPQVADSRPKKFAHSAKAARFTKSLASETPVGPAHGRARGRREQSQEGLPLRKGTGGEKDRRAVERARRTEQRSR